MPDAGEPARGQRLGPGAPGSCRVCDVLACTPLARPWTGLRKQHGASESIFFSCLLGSPSAQGEVVSRDYFRPQGYPANRHCPISQHFPMFAPMDTLHTHQFD